MLEFILLTPHTLSYEKGFLVYEVSSGDLDNQMIQHILREIENGKN